MGQKIVSASSHNQMMSLQDTSALKRAVHAVNQSEQLFKIQTLTREKDLEVLCQAALKRALAEERFWALQQNIVGLTSSDLDIPVTCGAEETVELVEVSRVHIRYPKSAQARGEEGEVLLKFEVHPSGQVVNVRIVESYASTRLKSYALEVVKTIRYAPFGREKLISGLPRKRIRFTFDLR